MITWKWRLETRRRFPTWWFGWSTRTHQYWRSGSTRVIYSPVSTAYRTHNLKYPKVYLSLKTFKSLIEHSWFFFTPLQFPFCSAMARDLRNPPYHPPLMSSVNFLSVFQFLDFQSTERADRKIYPRFVNAANFSQTVILFKGIRWKMDYPAAFCTTHCKC